MSQKTRIVAIRDVRHIKCPNCKKRHGIIITEDGNGLHVESVMGTKD